MRQSGRIPPMKMTGGVAPDHDAPASSETMPKVKRKRGGPVHGGKPHERLDKRARGGKTKGFHPGGEKGKLHREMGIPEGDKIPKDKLAAAARSSDPEKRRDAIRAETMAKWHHGKG